MPVVFPQYPERKHRLGVVVSMSNPKTGKRYNVLVWAQNKVRKGPIDPQYRPAILSPYWDNEIRKMFKNW